jgi:hypothetical protein
MAVEEGARSGAVVAAKPSRTESVPATVTAVKDWARDIPEYTPSNIGNIIPVCLI